MTNREEFDYFVEQMLDNAVKKYKSTEEYRLIQEKLSRMDEDCETMLTPEDRAFATECFELILEAKGREKRYVYQRGLSDGVKLLKRLGVLG